eukprot:TRINITY_DN95017_c0_g1_i1.p1 TRINITY_DN95017_c0_g1~~TRINITY_DN95017_c0_g1_i1.p1  ORF type:complete len:680 (-),score=234.98 TRINITY_DN95017_c0_g1_i1:94-2133(-)
MKAARAVLVAAALAGGANGEDGPRKYPVSKIVDMLQDMSKQLEGEAEKDSDLDEKMQCWCKTNVEEKTKQIEEAQTNTIPGLESIIANKKLEAVRHQTEGEGAKDALDKAETSLKSATDRRAQNKENYEKNTDEMKSNQASLRKAQARIEKLPPKTSFLSSTQTEVKGVLNMVKEMENKYANKLVESQKAMLLSIRSKVEQIQTSQEPTMGEVLGIIKEMDITFSRDLKEAGAKELEEAKNFEGMKAAKKSEIVSTKSTIVRKQEQQAKAEDVKAQSEEELTTQQEELASNEKFLADVKDRCSEHEKEYKERSGLRNEEMASVAKAVAILSNDDAKSTFSRTFNAPSFIQTSSKQHVQKIENAANILEHVAATAKDFKLASLAQKMKLQKDPMTFKKAVDAIAKMDEELKRKKQDETDTKENCEKDLGQNSDDTDKFTSEKTENSALSETLKNTIKEINLNTKTLGEEIATINEELKDASEVRDKQKAEYALQLKDQKQTQELLNSAITTLKSVYAPALVQRKGALVQTKEEPEKFEAYKQADNSVLALMNKVLDETIALEKASTEAEETADATFKTMKEDSENSIATKQESIVEQNEDKAKAEKSLIAAAEDVANAKEMLTTLASGLEALNSECSYLLKNYDLRQSQFQQEIDALAQAKGYLDGFEDHTPTLTEKVLR